MTKKKKCGIVFIIVLSLLFVIAQDVFFLWRTTNTYASLSFSEQMTLYSQMDSTKTVDAPLTIETLLESLFRTGNGAGDLDRNVWQNRVAFALIYLSFLGFFILLTVLRKKGFALFEIVPCILGIVVFMGLFLKVYSLALLLIPAALFFLSQTLFLQGSDKAGVAFHVISGIFLTGFGVFLMIKIMLKKLTAAGFWSQKLLAYYVGLFAVSLFMLFGFVYSLRQSRKEREGKDKTKEKCLQDAAIQYLMAALGIAETILFLAFHQASYYAVVFLNLYLLGFLFLFLQQAPPFLIVRDAAVRGVRRMLAGLPDREEEISASETAEAAEN